MLSRVSFFIAAWAALFIPAAACAGDSLDAVLARMQVKEVRHFLYTERRQMRLLTRQWRAEGEMFVSPRQIVVAQHVPDQRFISISKERIVFVDPGKQIRRQYGLQGRASVSGMALLMQVFYSSGKPADIEKKFNTGFSLNHNRWNITLLPKQEDDTEVIKMTLTGEEGAEPDHLALQYKDGDRTEWTLALRNKGDDASKTMDETLDQMNNSVDLWPGLSGS